MRDHEIHYGIILISSALQHDSYHFFLHIGSMYGNKIEYAKEAISYFVRFLQPGSYFNIISYGSTVLPLFRYRTFMCVSKMISDRELDYSSQLDLLFGFGFWGWVYSVSVTSFFGLNHHRFT